MNTTYRETWALYFSKFISEYKRHGVNIWGVTVQNEPYELPSVLQQSWETMFWTPEEQAAFVKGFLGPRLRRDNPDVKIIANDDQKIHLPDVARTILSDPDAVKFVDGLGVHWYMWPGSASPVIEAHEWMVGHGVDDVFLLGTEACSGFSKILSPPKVGPNLGSWTRGQAYAADIIADINAWVAGWTDWNLALDMEGGPNHAGNVVDAPILLDTKNGTIFYKQPMFYVMEHFSHFVPPGSVRIDTESLGPLPLECVAFLTPEDHIVLVLRNSGYSLSKRFSIHDPARGYLDLEISGDAIQTIIWKAGPPQAASAGPAKAVGQVQFV